MRGVALLALVAGALAAQTQTVPSVDELKFPPLRPVQIPTVETVTLPNGMRLYLLEDHELPLVHGMARIRTGNLFDPPEKVGLAGLTGTVMRTGGTKTKTGDQLDEQLENIAASVESSIGETAGTVSFSGLKDNTDEILGVFKDVLTQPEFRQEKIDLAKSQARSAIARRNDDAHGVAQREFSDLVYGKNTPYGWRVEYATIDRITRADAVAFYQRYYFPANIMLAVWGDFDTAAMKAKLERLFTDWTVKQPPVPSFPEVSRKPSPGTYLAVKPDVTQTFFVMGHLGGVLRDKDYPALEVMSDILGGGFRSRLTQRVRTRMGAAYSIGAGWGANYGHPGLFEISGSTKSESTVDTIRAVQEEVERIRTTEVTQDELETAKQSALNSLVFAFDTKAKTLGRLLTYEYWGYPKDFIYRYQKALEAVTRADVLRVSKEHLKPENFTLMMVGNPEQFGAPLEKLGKPVIPVDLTIPKPAAQAAATSPEKSAAGKKLLSRVQEAVGGAAKIAAVKDVVQVADVAMDPAAGGMKIQQTNRWVAPAHFRQDSAMAIGKMSAYSDGKSGWLATPQGVQPLSGPPLEQVQGEIFRNWFRLLAADRSGYQVTLASENQLAFSGPGGSTARVAVNPQTGLPERLIYESVSVSGPPATVEEQFSDYRDVNGLKVPFKTTIVQGGRKFAEVVVREYRINAGLTPDELKAQPK